jgi:hypothetical protein
MTYSTDRSNWTLEQQLAYERELQRKFQEWREKNQPEAVAAEKREREQLAWHRKQAEENQRRREAEAEQRRQQQREQQRLEARSKLEREKQQKREEWLDAGGNEQSFEQAWPQIEQQLLMSRLMTDEERVRRADTSHYDAGVRGGPPLDPTQPQSKFTEIED